LKKQIKPSTFSIATSISISFVCKFLLTALTAYDISYQMTIATKNSNSPSSLFAKDLASLLVDGSYDHQILEVEPPEYLHTEI
jgi:hypothetical protein